MKTPLERTVGELAALVESIRSDCALRATALLATSPPEAEALSDLARLDEALAKAQESVGNVCSALWVKQHLRQLRAEQTSSGNSL
jgi:hypothetical protein